MLPMWLVVPAARACSVEVLELGQPLVRKLANCLGHLGLRLDQPVESDSVEREAAQRRFRDDPRAAQPVVLDERDLADDLSGAELSFESARLDDDSSFADH